MTGDTKHRTVKDQLESEIADMERVALQGMPGGQGWHMRGDQSHSAEVRSLTIPEVRAEDFLCTILRRH